jgi:hypothetical protein
VVAFQWMNAKVFRYLLAVDRSSMSAEEVAQSKVAARRSVIGFFKPVLTGMFIVLKPSYSPRKVKIPPHWADARDEIEATWLKPGTALPA